MDDYKNNIYLEYPNTKLGYNDLTSKSITNIEPIISFSKVPGKLYTTIIVDPDAPSPDNPINKYHLHYLQINNNRVINQYSGPNPPINSGIHRYYTCVFEQDYRLELNQFPRAKFDLNKFVRDNKLKLVGCFKFRVKG